MKFKLSINISWQVLAALGIALSLIMASCATLLYRSYKHVTEAQARQLAFVEQQSKEQALRNEEASALIEAQAKALELAQTELQKTKTIADATSNQVNTLKKSIAAASALPKDIIISSQELNSYTSAVVQVLCKQGSSISSGSGTLWTFKEIPQAVITNHHVVKDADSCVAVMTNSSNVTTGIFSLSGSVYTYNQNTDTAILAINSSVSPKSVPIQNYNYTIGSLRTCPTTIPVGSPVVIIGYPAYAKRDTTMNVETLGTVNVIYRTVTNGIISGYDTSLVSAGTLQYPNYFVSAKIDSGNSGGIALAKDDKGICTLGLPTWLTVGNYETQGLVQNIANTLP